MSHGVAELPDFANQLLQNHEAILGAVNTFAREASPELLVAMITNMPADVHRMQHEVNPGTAPAEADEPMEAASICVEQGLDVGASESKYCRYATGFYVGYGAFTAVELVSGAKALVKGVRKASDLATKIEDVAKNADSVRGALRRGGDGAAARISVGVSEQIATAKNVGPRTVDRIVGVKETAGAKVRIARRVARFDGDVIDSLSSGEQGFFGRFLSRTSDGGVRLAADGGYPSLQRIYNFDLGGANKEVLASNIARQASRVGRSTEDFDRIEYVESIVNDLETISDNKIAGRRSLAEAAAKANSGDFRGRALEIRYAAKRSDSVLEAHRGNPHSKYPGDFDVVTEESGKIIFNEVKNNRFGTLDKEELDEFVGHIQDVDGGMDTVIRSSDIDDYRYIFGEEPPKKVRDTLENRGIEYRIIDRHT